MSLKVSAFKALMPMPKTAEKFVVVIPGLATTSSLYGQILNALSDPVGTLSSVVTKHYMDSHSVFLCHKAVFPTESWHSDKVWSNGIFIELPTRHNHPEDFRCTVSENMLCSVLTSIVDILSLNTFANGRELKDVFPRTPWMLTRNLEVYLLDQHFGTTPVTKRVLKGCWLKSVAPLDLNWQSATTPVDWQLTFAVQEIENSVVENAASTEVVSMIFEGLKVVTGYGSGTGFDKNIFEGRMDLNSQLAKLGISIPVV